MPDAPPPGALITFEGIDGTGKSTVVADIGRWLEKEGVKAAVQREPTTSWVGEAVRRSHVTRADPLTHTFLFLADRAQHTVFMRSQLAMGVAIVCDRYFDSTVAYQGAALADSLRSAGLDPLKWIRALHDPWALVPDLTLLFVDEPARCVERVKAARGHTSFFEEAPFLSAVQENYRELAAAEPQRFRVFESSDLDDLKSRSRSAVEDLLRSRGLLKAKATP
jgi:dTMP kinase